MICPGGIGDTYIICGLAESMLKVHGGKTITVYVKESHYFIPKLFPSITKIKIISPKQIPNFKKYHFNKGGIFYAHIDPGNIANLIGYKNITIIDCYRAFLKIPQTSQISIIQETNPSEINKAKDFLSSYSLKQGKTVILFFEASSSESMSVETARKICLKLSEKGYNIIINSKDDNKKVLDDFPSTKIPIDLLRPIASMAGWVITVRNGVADLLSDLNCKLTILYPKIIWNGGRFIDGANLKSMYLKKDIQELEILEDENFIESITN